MKRTVLLSVAAFAACFVMMSQIEVLSNGDLKIGTGATAIYFDGVGRFGSAKAWSFNGTTKGLAVEYGASESGGLHLDGDYAVIWSPGDQNRLLRIYDEDNMNAGSTTYERAYIDGNGSYVTLSDARRKENIVQVQGALNKLGRIKGVRYNYKQESADEKAKGQPARQTSGLLAQEVEAVIPEAVQTDQHGNKFMNYDALTPYLVEALKEQQAQIDSLRQELQKLKAR